MLYPQWSTLSNDEQQATVSKQNLGHALTDIRRALGGNAPCLAAAWKYIDNGDCAGYIEQVSSLSHADPTVIAKRDNAVRLAGILSANGGVPAKRSRTPRASSDPVPMAGLRQYNQATGRLAAA